jgi:UDP-N-acetylglucosamine 2-epimerase (non-hydrolysing)
MYIGIPILCNVTLGVFMNEDGTILLIAGARPNFMKLAPVSRALVDAGISHKIVHTGQHYDYNLSKVFFDDLEIPKPDYFLEVGSGTHATQTAKIMIEFEQLCIHEEPRLVLVFGDVNSTIACALVASKMGIKVGHIEAGLRSFDNTMPEETNRILTDHLSDYLFTTSELAVNNLLNEGIHVDKIFFVGNVMIDTLVWQDKKIIDSNILEKLSLSPGSYEVLTLHRPSNVDDMDKLKDILSVFGKNRFNKIIFPIHPRTRNSVEKFGLESMVERGNIEVIDPLGYNDFINLVSNSNCVWTDSGGIQEETSFLGVNCVTLRENTERPETLNLGTNILISPESKSILETKENMVFSRKRSIPLWDGKASLRIVEIISGIFK